MDERGMVWWLESIEVYLRKRWRWIDPIGITAIRMVELVSMLTSGSIAVVTVVAAVGF